MAKDNFVIFLGEVVKVNFGEPVKERLREGLAPASLAWTLAWILARKNEEIWMTCELLV